MKSIQLLDFCFKFNTITISLCAAVRCHDLGWSATSQLAEGVSWSCGSTTYPSSAAVTANWGTYVIGHEGAEYINQRLIFLKIDL